MSSKISQADVKTAFLQAVLAYGQAAMAGELDLAVSTLSNKLQPYNHPERRHFLNVFEADDIICVTGDMQPLHLWAARHDYVLLPSKTEPDGADMDDEVAQAYEAAAAFLMAARNGAKTKDLVPLLNGAVKELQDVLNRICLEGGKEK